VTRIVLYTAFALTAFAFNSILCRLALRGEEADAVGFTVVRLLSGAVTLVAISFIRTGRHMSRGDSETRGFLHHPVLKSGSWASALFLFAYAICFSFAYLDLTAATGALILFGAVQLTMIVAALVRGERPGLVQWLGLIVAAGGLVYLVLPGLASPPLASSLLMAAAGAAWGFYTLRGRGGGDPLADTTGNFVRSVPMVGVIAVVMLSNIHLSGRGVGLAVLSGAAASGIGYTVWYAALKYHAATRAAVLQLAVPVITAVLGIVLLAEAATVRLAIAAALILGGIWLTVFGRKP
jgi:drug/metabolite transporter (DMT)-like permease